MSTWREWTGNMNASPHGSARGDASFAVAPPRALSFAAMPVLPVALLVIVVGGIALARRVDVRLVLLGAAVALFLLRATQAEVAGHRADAFAEFFRKLAEGMVNPSFVVPICSAMGFAYVCKLTDCDAHLVHALVRPLRHVRPLLIP